MGYPVDCDVLYGNTEEGIQTFYNEKAHEYNAFLEETNYVLHTLVAEHASQRFTDIAGRAVDLACGTGKLGIAMRAAKPKMSIDGIDFSSAMLAIANEGKMYTQLHSINVKTNLPDLSQTYDLLVSSGSFTPSHLDAADLVSAFSLLHSGGLGVVSIKKDWYESENFQQVIDGAIAANTICNPVYSETMIWDHPDYNDTAIIFSFNKN